MASRNVMIGTGAALAGLGGLGVAALTANGPDAAPAPAKADAQPVVQTQTVVVRKVEHRVVRAKTRRRANHVVAAVTTPAVAPAATAAPVVQQAPATVSQAAPALSTHPIRTRTSGGGQGGAAGEREHDGNDDRAEHADD